MSYPSWRPWPSGALVPSYAILAAEPDGTLGIAAQSRRFAMGASAIWVWPDVGATVVQALVDPGLAHELLRHVAAGMAPELALATCMLSTPDADLLHAAIIDRAGRTAVHGAPTSSLWSGAVVGPGFVCQGVALGGAAALNAMAAAFVSAKGDLAERMTQALEAGQCVEGGKRWARSAALRMVSSSADGATTTPEIDLRVDDHPDPTGEIRRLLDLHRLYATSTAPGDLLLIDPTLTYELQTILHALGYLRAPISAVYDEVTRNSLARFLADEQLHRRLQSGPWIDRKVLDLLRAWRARLR
jgi:uncharacterized Ntn-hydrolase superfamily protein